MVNSTKWQYFGLGKIESMCNDILHAGKMMISVFDRLENIVWKGENAGY